jgi:hypothetical protein
MLKKKIARSNDYFLTIVDAICYWLGYQKKIGRKHLLHEASLRYPIADFITSKGISIERVILEYLHPIYKGRKIDLVILSEVDKENSFKSENIKEVFEFKLVNSNTGKEHNEEHQRVLDDLLRLAKLNCILNKDCYFLMCGEFDFFKRFFVGQVSDVNNDEGKHKLQLKTFKLNKHSEKAKNWISEGIYKDWFAFYFNGEKIVEISTKDHSKWGLVEFIKNYKIRDEFLNEKSESIKFKTICVGITPLSLEKSRTHAAGIWKIESINK